MLIQAILVAVFMAILLTLMGKKINVGKLEGADEGPKPTLGDALNFNVAIARLLISYIQRNTGILKTLQVALSFIIGGTVPNYELLANWTKTCGGLMIINIPTKGTCKFVT